MRGCQDLTLFSNLSVAENIALSRNVEQHHFFLRNARRVAREALAKINARFDLDELVGGSVARRPATRGICRALMAEARLLIMDRSTTG